MTEKTLKNRISHRISLDRIPICFLIVSLVVEIMAVFTVEGSPIIRRPWIDLGVFFLCVGILFLIRSNRVRFILGLVFLVLEAVLDLSMTIVFDMTEQYFDFGMLKLRNDAFGILEAIPMNFTMFYVSFSAVVCFSVLSIRHFKTEKKAPRGKKGLAVSITAITIGVIMMAASLFGDKQKVNIYDRILTGNEGGVYNEYGVMGNLIREMVTGIFGTNEEVMSSKEISRFVYGKESEPTKYFGVSEGNNVVMVLVESLEWYPFIQDPEFPNQIKLTEEELDELFPNLRKFYKESTVMRNFHSREKTDISETLSILGSYPTGAYINYDYPENTVPYTMPRTLQELDPDIQCTSYHNGFKSFYNREEAHKMFGFSYLTDCYDMEDMSDAAEAAGGEATMHNYLMDGERNLDTEMIATCKDQMFPTDRRFYTYITTITMHGMYYERKNLTAQREKLDQYYTLPEDAEEYERDVYNYMSAVMLFDEALGMMMDDLREKGLLDHTTIILFGDHNTYYNELSSNIKDIHGYDTERYYTDLFNVPLMIYDENIEPQTIDKFTCTADMVPTLLDLLGIRYFSNLYYGNSVYSEEQSVLYSRAYGILVDEGIVGRSINQLLYQAPSVTNDQLEDFRTRTRYLVKKIRVTDQIFRQDYFGKKKNLQSYTSQFRKLNGLEE